MSRVAITLLAAVSMVTAFAHADDALDARYFDARGRAYYAAGDLDDALRAFLLAHRISPSVATRFNVALIAQLSGDALLAFAYFEQVRELAPAESPLALESVRRQEEVAREIGVLRVEGSPSGARIFIDREDHGVAAIAPTTLGLEPGSRRILVRAEGHAPAEYTQDLTAGQQTVLRYRLEPHVGQVRFVDVPVGASVELWSETDEPTRLEGRVVSLPVGRHRVRACRDGRCGSVTDVVVARGETSRVRVSLPAGEADAESTGRLVVRSAIRATVHLDGVPRAVTPVVLGEVENGSHLVSLRTERGTIWESRVRVEAGQSVRLDIDESDLHHP